MIKLKNLDKQLWNELHYQFWDQLADKLKSQFKGPVFRIQLYIQFRNEFEVQQLKRFLEND